MKIKLDEGAFAPIRAHSTDAGMDLRSPVDTVVYCGDGTVIDTGVHIELPHGTVGMLKSKSGLNVKHGITSEGVIDEGYTGSIKVKLYSHGIAPYHVKRGDKITQLVVIPVQYECIDIVENIDAGERGDAGFGSTGR